MQSNSCGEKAIDLCVLRYLSLGLITHEHRATWTMKGWKGFWIKLNKHSRVRLLQEIFIGVKSMWIVKCCWWSLLWCDAGARSWYILILLWLLSPSCLSDSSWCVTSVWSFVHCWVTSSIFGWSHMDTLKIWNHQGKKKFSCFIQW